MNRRNVFVTALAALVLPAGSAAMPKAPQTVIKNCRFMGGNSVYVPAGVYARIEGLTIEGEPL